VKEKPIGRLVTRDGRRGEISLQDRQNDMVLLKMDDGQQVWAPLDLIEKRSEGSYYLPVDLKSVVVQEANARLDNQTVIVVPIVQEELRVDKERQVTGRVRVNKHVHSREEVVDEPGFVEEVQVERIPVNRILEQPISPRQEGDTLIIPLMEEVLVVEKRLVLREELHVKKNRKVVRNPQKLTLRSEEVSVERLDEQRKSGR
jgi:uncharacterized protein (TIGR02271 family)